MATTMHPYNPDIQPLMINGIQVDPRLLEDRPLRRCQLNECQGYCCGGGVFIREDDMNNVLANADLFQPYLPPERRDPSTWFYEGLDPDNDHPEGGQGSATTTVDDPTHPIETCCVFLRPDRKCALQLAGLEKENKPWHYKPLYCALHPLTYDNKWLMLDDANPMYQIGGSCSRPTENGKTIPFYQLFADEIKLALGESGYQQLDALYAAK